jgi:hypothetical protein
LRAAALRAAELERDELAVEREREDLLPEELERDDALEPDRELADERLDPPERELPVDRLDPLEPELLLEPPLFFPWLVRLLSAIFLLLLSAFLATDYLTSRAATTGA